MNLKILDSFQLKMIALITMTIDHIGFLIFPEYTFLRIIGRVSFILFAFLLAQGFFKTSNRIRYISIITIFGLAINLFVYLPSLFGFDIQAQPNIFITLSIGLIIMTLLEQKSLYYYLLALIIFYIFSPFGDYQYYGVSVIILFYFYFKYKFNFVYLFLGFLLIQLFYCNITQHIVDNNAVIHYFKEYAVVANIQWYSIFAFIFIYMYNYQRGYYNKVVKYLIYIYYPVHLVILYLISLLV